MCRMLAYVGESVRLDDLLIKPDSSLIHQVVDAQMLSMLNLAGYGLAAWDDAMADAHLPLLFRSTDVAIFDPNLRSIAAKLRVRALIAHLRGIPYDGHVAVNRQSLHPFSSPGSPLVMAHNGDLARFGEMRYDLAAHIRPDILPHIAAMTDSAWLYALILSCIDGDLTGPFDPAQLLAATERALSIIRDVRARRGIHASSSVNLLLGDGRSLIAVRFTFDFGRFERPPFQGGVNFLSLWYTMGAAYQFADGEWKMTGGSAGASTLVASEPATRDVATWVEVPEYAALIVDGAADGSAASPRRRIAALDI
ncbi:MAG: class II glutamine amidotransferase [Sphingomonadaceae bacterium]|nr:class II glutamine amidotransferase [Sphingomonadaceae bacterium]